MWRAGRVVLATSPLRRYAAERRVAEDRRARIAAAITAAGGRVCVLMSRVGSKGKDKGEMGWDFSENVYDAAVSMQLARLWQSGGWRGGDVLVDVQAVCGEKASRWYGCSARVLAREREREAAVQLSSYMNASGIACAAVMTEFEEGNLSRAAEMWGMRYLLLELAPGETQAIQHCADIGAAVAALRLAGGGRG